MRISTRLNASLFLLTGSLLVGASFAGCGSSSSSLNSGAPGGGTGDEGGTSNDGGTTNDEGGTTNDGGTTDRDGGTLPDGAPAPVGIKTIFLILMENHNWSDVKSSASAPYINNTLLTHAQASYTDNYFDNPKNIHPSEPNYIWLESGDNLGWSGTLADIDPSVIHSQSTTDHLTTQLKTAGVTWKSYQEGISGTDCPISSSGLYAVKHNPMLFFHDVSGSPPSHTPGTTYCKDHVRPYSELATDLTANTVAQYNFITPNLCDDMHNPSGCATTDEVKNGDNWLATEVPKILASHAYQDHGALFITWDESENGEFPIGMIVLSPLAKGHGYVSHTKYFHSSMLRTVEEVFKVPLLRDAANQPNLSDLFTTYP